ncbi:MAG TPA: exopolyphosphatase [Nitrospiria bacterium]
MRLVTRGDLDGLTSAVLISTMENIESIELIHPQDITDNKFKITKNDIMANLPYNPECALWFDHHLLTKSNKKPPEDVKGRHALAPSTARVIYDYYQSEKLRKFEHLVQETDRLDSAQLTREDVLSPEGVVLLGFTVDGRTGIGAFKDYFLNLVERLQTLPIDEVLKLPEVAERISLIQRENTLFQKSLMDHSRLDGNVVITDFRPLEKVPVGNRFLVYTLFPDANVSVRLQRGPQNAYVVATLGHSIFNRTSMANCGEICSRFGGGGHKGAGAVPLKGAGVEEKISEIIQLLKE